MNKIIFQIGLLGFCVSAVLFGTQGMSLMETVARAFIVFIAVECAIAVMMLMSSLIMAKDRAEEEGAAPAGAPREAGPARRPTTQPSK